MAGLPVMPLDTTVVWIISAIIVITVIVIAIIPRLSQE